MKLVRPLLVFGSVLALSSPSFAQITPVPATSYRVSGTVQDGQGNPIDKAEVIVQGDKNTRQNMITGPDGRFSLGDFNPGGATLRVRRLGYQQYDLKIAIGSDLKLANMEVFLRELPQKLEEILVKSDEEGRLRDFTEHKNERNNFGRYFDRVEIRKRNPSYASELFRTVPGMQVQSSSFGGNTIRMRGCKPLVWMDGQRIPGAELDEVVRPADIAGLEVYSSNAGIPPEYMDRNNGACGIIVVWTKSS